MRSVLAVALLASAGQAVACGSNAVPFPTFDARELGDEHVALILTESFSGGFQTCHSPFIYAAGFEAMTATFNTGDGQTFNARWDNPSGLNALDVPLARIEVDVDYKGLGFFVASVSNIVITWNFVDEYVDSFTGVSTLGNIRVGHSIDSTPLREGLNIASHAPEPATYAMMLAGLGLLGWRRATRSE